MWNKQRREEEPARTFVPSSTTTTPSLAAAAPAEKKEAYTVSTPSRSFEPEAKGGSATIGKAVRINGQINSKEDLYVDGDVEGTVEAPEHKLTIGPNGTVHASVKAREVVALGSIQGNVEAADRIEIRRDAKLVGDIRTARIVIEDGAYFKGSIDIVKPEPAKPAARPAQAAAPAQAAPVAHAPASAAVPEKR
jgi:cytoskeletal protein CcmA (bactofilin family)